MGAIPKIFIFSGENRVLTILIFCYPAFNVQVRFSEAILRGDFPKWGFPNKGVGAQGVIRSASRFCALINLLGCGFQEKVWITKIWGILYFPQDQKAQKPTFLWDYLSSSTRVGIWVRQCIKNWLRCMKYIKTQWLWIYYLHVLIKKTRDQYLLKLRMMT